MGGSGFDPVLEMGGSGWVRQLKVDLEGGCLEVS